MQYVVVDMQVQYCDQCQRTKRKFDHPAAQLHPVPVPNHGWKQIGIDLIGPLPCTELENKYVMTVMDYFTKWPKARAIPTKEAVNVADFLFDLSLRHGCPDTVISDQGKEFCNQVCLELMSVMVCLYLQTSLRMK